jgi:release factor glutamine methyltransferase
MMTLNKYRQRALSILEPIHGDREARAIMELWFERRLKMSKLDQLFVAENLTQFHGFEQDLLLLSENVPVQYILKESFFIDFWLEVNPFTLVPRPETEELVRELALWLPNLPLRVLDVGTGSGCIALGLKFLRSDLNCSGVDLQYGAVQTAERNAKHLQLDVVFNVLDVLSTSFNEVDVVVSNPPYIPRQERDLMKNHVVFYEPDVALFVPDHDPLMFYRRLIELGISQEPTPAKYFAFEIHEDFGPEMLALCREYSLKDITLKEDFQGKNRMIFAKYDR